MASRTATRGLLCDPAWEPRLANGTPQYREILAEKDGTFTLEVSPLDGPRSYTPVNTNSSLTGSTLLRLPTCSAGRTAGFPSTLFVRIALIDCDVPSYFQSLEHLLRSCARPPFALERLSVTRDSFLTHRPRPLRAPPTQGRHLGRPGPLANVHAAWLPPPLVLATLDSRFESGLV